MNCPVYREILDEFISSETLLRDHPDIPRLWETGGDVKDIPHLKKKIHLKVFLASNGNGKST